MNKIFSGRNRLSSQHFEQHITKICFDDVYQEGEYQNMCLKYIHTDEN